MKISLYLFAAALARVTASGTTRGSEMLVDKQLEPSNTNRRHLMEESTCTLYRKCVVYAPTEEQPRGHEKHTWVCQLSSEDAEKYNTKYVDIVESSAVAVIANAVSGVSTLTMSEAFIDIDKPRLVVPNHARVTMGTIYPDSRDADRQRHLEQVVPRTGTLKALMIRVTDKNNNAPEWSLDELRGDVFDEDRSLKSQIEGCSYDQLRIEPFVGHTPSNYYIDNGTLEMTMDYDVFSDQGDIGMEATIAAYELLGDLEDPMFGLIMFCLPSGRDNFAAYAYLNGKNSYYEGDYCRSVAVQQHEVGHNLNLEHSGETGEGEYGDGTGSMGSIPWGDDPRVCFNAQKSYQLQWYADQVESINPIDGTGSWNYVLNGVADYQKNENALVVLRLEQTDFVQDYYVNYNLAEGINSAVVEDPNKVIIVRKDNGSPDDAGYSTKLAALRPGESYVIDDFNLQRIVRITYLGDSNGNANIEVSDVAPMPTPVPGSCKEFTIEFITDSREEDSSWQIADTEGTVVAEQPSFLFPNTFYSRTVCLPMDDVPKTYKFSVSDSYGDGVCCYYGDGVYRVLDDVGVELISSDFIPESFAYREYELEVPARGTPPTCKPFTVETVTNAHPEDNSWVITDAEGRVAAEQTSFRNPWSDYSKTVCLPIDDEPQTYKFTFKDSFGDGICCEYGNGVYKVIDGEGQELISSDFKYEGFYSQEHDIEVPGTPQCKNANRPFRMKEGGAKRKCKWYKKKKKCDKMISAGKHEGKFVWEVCRKACGRCASDLLV